MWLGDLIKVWNSFSLNLHLEKHWRKIMFTVLSKQRKFKRLHSQYNPKIKVPAFLELSISIKNFVTNLVSSFLILQPVIGEKQLG